MRRADSLEKTLMLGKTEGRRRTGRQRMRRRDGQLDGHEFEQALGAGDGQGGLMCCSPWGHKEWDTPEWLNWTVCLLIFFYLFTFNRRIIALQYCIGFYNINMKYLNISPSLKCDSGSVLLYSSVFRMQYGYVAKHIVSLVMGACLSFISSFNPAHVKHLAFPKGTMFSH